MAARVCPENVRSAHQSMHHLVADAEWDDRLVLIKYRVITVIRRRWRPLRWRLRDDPESHGSQGGLAAADD